MDAYSCELYGVNSHTDVHARHCFRTCSRTATVGRKFDGKANFTSLPNIQVGESLIFRLKHDTRRLPRREYSPAHLTSGIDVTRPD